VKLRGEEFVKQVGFKAGVKERERELRCSVHCITHTHTRAHTCNHIYHRHFEIFRADITIEHVFHNSTITEA